METIFPVTLLQSKLVVPSTSAQTVVADSGYNGLSTVVVEATPVQSKTTTPSTSSQNIQPDNGYVGLSSVVVNPTPLQSKSVVTSTSAQTVEPDSGYVGLSSVVVPAVTTENIDAANIKNGIVVKVGDVNNAGRIKEVTGTFASDATITAHDVMNGKTGYNGSVKIEGDLNYYTITMTGNTGSSNWAVDSSHVVTFTGDISSHPNLLKIVGITKISDSWNSRYFIAAGYATAYSDDIFSYSVSGTTLSLTMRIYVDDSVNANTSMTFQLTYLGY